jgi:hypothetical protein
MGFAGHGCGVDLAQPGNRIDLDPTVRDAFGVLIQARTKLETQRFETLLQTREVLTADQWRKLRDVVRERRMEKGRGGPPEGRVSSSAHAARFTMTRLGLQIPNFNYQGVSDEALFERIATIAGEAENAGFDTLSPRSTAHRTPGR